MKKSKISRISALLAAGTLLLGGMFMSCSLGDDDDGDTADSGPKHETLGTSFEFSGYKWKLNNGSATLSSDGSVLTVTPASVGVSLQLDDSELASLYEKYPAGFSITAKLRPDLSKKGNGSAFASSGTGNFGVVSNVVVDGGFYGSFVNSNGRMQLGTYQNAKGSQFGSLLTDNSGTILKKQIEEPYVIRLQVENDVLSSTINGIVCDKSGSTTYSVPENAKVARSATSGSYGILTEFATSYELYSFSVQASNEGLAAIKMTTTETDSIATLKENTTAYVFLNSCAYTTKIGADAITFSVSATNDDGSDATSGIIVSNSSDSVATALIADVGEDGRRVITVTPVAIGTDVITVTSGRLARTITVTVEKAATYKDTDYASTTALYPANAATGVYEDDHLVLTFDEAPVLGEGYVEIYDADGNVVDKVSVDGSDANTITDGNKSQLYQLKYFMVQVVGNKVEIIPNCNKLENGKTYHVGIAEGVITGKINGKDFTGFAPEKGRWTFTVRDSKPGVSSSIRVGSSDSADFRTVQGAFQAVSEDSTITVEKGTYREILLYTKSYNIKLVGETATEYGKDVVIQGVNCNSFNGSSDTRAAFHFKTSADLTLENITIQNAYDRNTMGGTAQSEALYFNSTGHLAAYNSSFLGHQDTLLTKGKNWFYKCYIEGDTDFVWGYADACLIEESKVVQLDTSKDSVPASGSYVFETRVSSDAASAATVGKGYVLFNSELVAEHPNSCIGRRASAAGSAGSNYYDQFAAINVNVSSGNIAKVYGGNNSAVFIDADSNGNQNVGAKVYGCNGITADTNVNGSGTITEDVYNAEYSGRAAILNKVYKKTGKYANDTNIWDYSALETEFGATTDTSKLDDEEKVEGANGTYDICSLAEAATTASDSTKTSFKQNDALTDGTSADGYVSWKNLLWHSGSSSYGAVTSAVAGKETVVTIKVAGASIVTWTGSSYSNGTVTVTDGNSNTIVNAVSTKESSDKTSQGFLYTGTSETTLTLSFNAKSTYINNLVVKVLDDETNSVASVTVSGSGTLAAAVQATYLSTDTSVTWKSSNPSVATVDKGGVVTGIAAGTATITATSVATSSISDSKEIKVTADASNPIYGYTYSYNLKGGVGTPYSSDDGILKVAASGDNGGHGLIMKDGNTIVLKVAGAGKVTLGTCAYDKGSTITVADAAGALLGTVSVSKGDGSNDKTSVDFDYAGEADTLTFTYSSNAGQNYLHGVTIAY